MDEQERLRLEAELNKLNKRYEPGKWQGEPYELLQSYDEIGFAFEGNLGERIKGAQDVFLKRAQQNDQAREAQALQERQIAPDMQVGLRSQFAAENDNRAKDLNQNPQWIEERELVQHQYEKEREYIWKQVASAQEQAARANGIDPENVRNEKRLDDRAAVLAGRAEAPQVLPLWEAADRREERSNSSTDGADRERSDLEGPNETTEPEPSNRAAFVPKWMSGGPKRTGPKR